MDSDDLPKEGVRSFLEKYIGQHGLLHLAREMKEKIGQHSLIIFDMIGGHGFKEFLQVQNDYNNGNQNVEYVIDPKKLTQYNISSEEIIKNYPFVKLEERKPNPSVDDPFA